MTNEETDTALILEGELKRRVKELVQQAAYDIVRNEMREEFRKQKADMMLEISIAVGKMMRVMEAEGRKPLWEATPEEFGLTREELNRSSIRRLDDIPQENLKNAICK